jgi:hypothetical protein
MGNDFNTWFKEMFINECKVALDNQASTEGTAIPVGEAVDTLYFNIYNSIEETNALLSQLTFVQTPFLEYPIYVAYANTHDGNSGNFITVTNLGGGKYTIANVYNIAEQTYMDVYDGSDGIERHNGWWERIVGPQEHITAGIRLSTWAPVITDLLGIPIGAENDKIKNVLSITPFANGFKAGVSKGKIEEHDHFWDVFQQNGNRTYYRYAFYGQNSGVWTDEIYNPKYPIRATESIGGDSMFQASAITDTKVDIEIGANSSYVFISCPQLKTIRKLTVSENTTFNRWFDGCEVLENVTFEGVIANDISFVHSLKLTNASVQNIIDHLKNLTGQTTQTLTLHEYVGRDVTDNQKAAISAKNWTLKY